jgi:hypothetical protein
MNSARRHMTRTLLLAVALLGLTAPSETSSSAASNPNAESVVGIPAENPVTAIRPEGRLRKLHLVRPDLIPYPIAYEVYC